MEKFWFFNSAPSDPRTYQAQDFADYFGTVLTNGIVSVDSEMGLRVTAPGGNMQVDVSAGKAIIKGNRYENTDTRTLTVDLPEAAENRIDRIVLRHDLTNANRHIKLFVKRGTASAPPALQRDNFIYEISLAQILLESNTSTINPANITDERLDENLAGIVHSMVTVPTSQFQEQWDEFFENVQQSSTLDIRSGQYSIAATSAGQTDFAIPQITFNPARDVLTVFVNTTKAPFSSYSVIPIENGYAVRFAEGKAIGTLVEFETVKAVVNSDEFPAWASDVGITDAGGLYTATNVESALQEIAGEVGNLSSLNTTNKTSLVNAVNELFTDVGDGKALLETTIESKGGTVSDINEPPTWQDLATGIGTITTDIVGETVKAAKFIETIAKGERVNVFYDGGASTALANPDVLPTGNADAVAWSPDGNYMAASSGNAPHLVLYKRTGDTFTKLANPATLPTGAANGSKALAWSPDGKYLAVAHIASPYLTIYEQTGDTFTKLANPSTLPVGTGNGVAWSPDGKTLVVGSDGSNRLIRYDLPSFYGMAFGSSSGTGVSSVSFSPDGKILMTSPRGGGTSDRLIRYNASGNYSQSNDLINATSGSVVSTAWSSDGQYLAVGSNTLYIFKYNKVTDTFTYLSGSITGGSVTSAYGVSWSADDRYLLVSGDTSPYINVFKRTGDMFARQPNPAILPTAFAYSAAYSPTGQYLTVGFRATPFVRTYKASDSVEKNIGNIPRATRLGYAKEGGTSGQTKNVGILFQ